MRIFCDVWDATEHVQRVCDPRCGALLSYSPQNALESHGWMPHVMANACTDGHRMRKPYVDACTE